ncbi:hypothetical protein ACEQPO_05725 [Bacillus sp. SL00103]
MPGVTGATGPTGVADRIECDHSICFGTPAVLTTVAGGLVGTSKA